MTLTPEAAQKIREALEYADKACLRTPNMYQDALAVLNASTGESSARPIPAGEIERVALAMLNRGRIQDGHPTVASFDGFDEETTGFWRQNAVAAIAVLRQGD